MAFIRIKKFKQKNGALLEYAYLVQNKWRKSKKGVKRSPKQKVKEYLGRVYKLEKVKDVDFWETIDLDQERYLKIATKEKILHDLVRYELIRFGFVNCEGKWFKDDVLVDIGKKKVTNNLRSKCVLAINEGHLCNYRLKRLYAYDKRGDIEEIGYELARLFIESGIDIPQEVFIVYYEKL